MQQSFQQLVNVKTTKSGALFQVVTALMLNIQHRFQLTSTLPVDRNSVKDLKRRSPGLARTTTAAQTFGYTGKAAVLGTKQIYQCTGVTVGAQM
jgi:hypothetical protein